MKDHQESLEGFYFELEKTYDAFKFYGEDVVRFLNGQLTNDLESLTSGAFQLQCRLTRVGRVVGYFYLLRDGESFYAIVPKAFSDNVIDDIKKFIIMDDVELERLETAVSLIFSAYEHPQKEYSITNDVFSGLFANFPAHFSFSKPNDASPLKKIDEERLRKEMILGGEPVVGVTAVIDELVTNQILNLRAVSPEKGCYLGQETVSKINTRRGGAFFPVAIGFQNGDVPHIGAPIKVEDRNAGKVLEILQFGKIRFIISSLLRDFRVDGREVSFDSDKGRFKGKVNYLPLGGGFDKEAYIQDLYSKAVDTFQKESEKEAILAFEGLLKVDSKNEDVLEGLGVLLGRVDRFEEGIELMDLVLKSNPDSIMAHTNKSLFLMRLGKIEEAEEEKAQATVKSFSKFGKEAKEKKNTEEMLKREQEDIERRYNMFKQVLELDHEDELANFGLADISFKRNDYEASISLLNRVLDINSDYSVAYLLLGKCYEKIANFNKAKEVYETGILIASKKGDLMPANEMQERLSKI